MTYTNKCPTCESVFDWLAPRFTTPDPMCPECGGVTIRQITAPAIVWTRNLADYGDKSKETYSKDQRNGGHFVFEKNSDAAQAAGRPLKRFIQTAQDQREYCRAEGVINPKDIPGNLKVDQTGTKYETANRSEL